VSANAPARPDYSGRREQLRNISERKQFRCRANGGWRAQIRA
jgi:hypothetical protein